MNIPAKKYSITQKLVQLEQKSQIFGCYKSAQL